MRIILSVLLALSAIGCAINQGMAVKRTAHYNAQGELTGYAVEETVHIPRVMRPADRAQSDVLLFETGTTLDRKQAKWPPPRSGVALRPVVKR